MRTVLVKVMLALAALASPAVGAQPVTITVQVPYAKPFRTPIHETIAAEFMKHHPGIQVEFRTPYANYDDAIQQTLRGAITGDLPDITYQGLNRQRTLVDRGLAVPLTPFIEKEADWAKRGYSGALMRVGTIGGKVYGMAFAISTPVAYYNLELVRKAGGNPERLPQTWDEVLALAAKIKALGGDQAGLYYHWDVSGNWMWQSLISSQGGEMLTPDEKKVAFGGAEGKRAMALLSRFVREGGMPNVPSNAALQMFAAGKLGMLFTTTAYLAQVQKLAKGRFDIRTAPFPRFPGASQMRLPAGGNTGMILAKDPAKQRAAWEYLKFASGPFGSTVMVKATGYMPPNTNAAADPKYLKSFYDENPNHRPAVEQLPLITDWFAYPGENGLKITDVIRNHLETVVSGQGEPDAVLEKMVAEVQGLLPR